MIAQRAVARRQGRDQRLAQRRYARRQRVTIGRARDAGDGTGAYSLGGGEQGRREGVLIVMVGILGRALGRPQWP